MLQFHTFNNPPINPAVMHHTHGSWCKLLHGLSWMWDITQPWPRSYCHIQTRQSYINILMHLWDYYDIKPQNKKRLHSWQILPFNRSKANNPIRTFFQMFVKTVLQRFCSTVILKKTLSVPILQIYIYICTQIFTCRVAIMVTHLLPYPLG